jgi:VIT1/CCC1 family predicted Fe2+/Mn2+ transporter
VEAHDQAGRSGSGRATAALAAGLVGAAVPLILVALGGQSSDPSAGLVAALIALGLVASVLGIVLGTLARREAARDGSAGGGGPATVGIVTGTIGMLFVAFVGIVLLSGQKLY